MKKSVSLFFIFSFTSLFAQQPPVEWMKQICGAYNQDGEVVLTDHDDNIYLAGHFRGTADFDPGSGVHEKTSHSQEDIFLVKMTPDGSFAWMLQMGGNGNEQVYSLCETTRGIIVAGYFSDELKFANDKNIGFKNEGIYTAFVALISKGGKLLQIWKYGGTGYIIPSKIISDEHSNLYLAGQFTDNGAFDPASPTNLATAKEGSDGFLCKYDSLGNLKWTVTFAGLNYENISDITFDAEGSVYVTGSMNGPLAINSESWDNQMSSANYGFIAKFSPEGKLIFKKRLGENNPANPGWKIISAAPDCLFISGQYSGKQPFPKDIMKGDTTNLQIEKSGINIFIARFNATGNMKWVKMIGGKGTDQALGMVMDADTNIYITGQFYDVVDFDPGPGLKDLTTNSVSYSDGYVASYDKNGKYRWATDIGSTGEEFSQSIEIDNSGNLILTGLFFSNEFFVGETKADFKNAGYSDAFVVKIKSENGER